MKRKAQAKNCNFMIFKNCLIFLSLNLVSWWCSVWVWVTFCLYCLTFSECLNCTCMLLIKSGVLLHYFSLHFCFSSPVVPSLWIFQALRFCLFFFFLLWSPLRVYHLYWLIFKFEYTISCQHIPTAKVFWWIFHYNYCTFQIHKSHVSFLSCFTSF